MSTALSHHDRRTSLQYSRKQNSLDQVVSSRKLTTSFLCRKKKKGESILRVKTLEESLSSDPTYSSSATSTTSFLTATTISESSTRRSSLDSNASTTVSTCSNFTVSPRLRRKKGHVSFSDIHFRLYNMTIGDNPSCSSGAPVSLNWSYNPDPIICSLEDYEISKVDFPRRSRSEMLIPLDIRHKKLKEEWCVSTSEILRAIKENKMIQEQRYKSSMQRDASVRAQAMFQNVKCSVRKLMVKD